MMNEVDGSYCQWSPCTWIGPMKPNANVGMIKLSRGPLSKA